MGSTSKIQIYNFALVNLGMGKIFSTDTSDPRLIACELFYPQALEDTYAEGTWSFATVKEQLALVSTTDDAGVVGWDYVYAYPPKAAKVDYVFSEANVDYREEQDFEIVFLADQNKKVVCSNEASAYQEYTYIVEDTTIFSAKFVVALSFKLAALIAQTLTTDPGIVQAMQQNASMIIQEAKRLDFKNKPKEKKQTNKIVNSR